MKLSPISKDLLPGPPEFLLRTYQLTPEHGNLFSNCLHRSLDERPTPRSRDSARPYVTLTFAQSLDAKIAGAGGKQLPLSGKESMVMTHWMRTMHDAILVGIGTAVNDDPQLNVRHLPALPAGSPDRYHLPRPVILDTNLRLSSGCKLLKNFNDGRGRRPWVVCSVPAAAGAAWLQRKEALEHTGARIVEVRSEHDRIEIPALLSTLCALGIRSLMVEGGAQVIRSFLAAAGSPVGETPDGASDDRPASLVDMVIVTVAPMLVGAEGVGYGSDLHSEKLPTLRHVQTESFGRDAVVALEVR